MGDRFGGQYYPAGMGSERATSEDTLWLQIIPRRLVINDINARLNQTSDTTTSYEPMWFLMPSQLMTNIKHNWDDLATPAGALRDITSKISNQLKLADETGKYSGNGISTGHKADNPYLYVGTERRTLGLSLEFSVFSDTYSDVFYPIQELIRHSSPEIASGSTEFTYPYIFSLQTWTGTSKAVDVISIKSVAITSVQPTYLGPWIGGYPSKATVEIDFEDLNPLYKSTLYNEQHKRITTRPRNNMSEKYNNKRRPRG